MYTLQFLKLSETMKTDACFGLDRNTGLYFVHLKAVFVKKPEDLDTQVHYEIRGQGTTIEDACHHYISKARGMYLYHIITNLTEFII